MKQVKTGFDLKVYTKCVCGFSARIGSIYRVIAFINQVSHRAKNQIFKFLIF
ncbi:hypothetical protein DESAMIL20_76 [Desulfurella amilsii]|uniref:Uncharacterized protein n=1 Tax=Desulfurella amilsii TaxID=1562698 RepID=A0A1X4XZL9_9BACT|nr:hypothetical protein DESAMIL20_76 [Desulfurella amilsii]